MIQHWILKDGYTIIIILASTRQRRRKVKLNVEVGRWIIIITRKRGPDLQQHHRKLRWSRYWGLGAFLNPHSTLMSSAFTRSRERMSVKWRRFCFFCVIFSSSSTSNDFAILLRLRNNCANKHRMRSMSLFRCNRIQDWLTVKSESCRELSCDQPQKLPKLSRKTKKQISTFERC